MKKEEEIMAFLHENATRFEDVLKKLRVKPDDKWPGS
jgi:hypothetical protein